MGKKKEEALQDLESLRPALAELERAAVWIANRTLDNITHKVLITIQSRGKKANCLGWFDKARWSTREGEPIHELNITAEYLQRDPVDIIETMAHELCHLQNSFADIKDVAKGGRHNKKFKEQAEIMGLAVEEPYDGRGYAYTSLTDEFREEILEDFKPDVVMFNLFREIKLVPKAENKTKAYICECEKGPTIRTAKEFRATCDDCQASFVLKEA